MADQIDSFRNVLKNIEKYSTRCWVYLPSDGNWHLESKSAVLASDEVPPEMEDEPDAGVPKLARQNRLVQALTVTDTQGIVRNAKMQVPDAGDEQLFEAFMYYFVNDSFMQCPAPPTRLP